MKRRTFAATALATACAGPALAQSPALLTLNLTGTSADDATPALYAEKAGLFRAAGLDTIYQRANSGAAAIAAVVGGAADIGKSSMGSIITARAKAIDIKLVAGAALFRGTNQAGEVLLLVPSDSALRTARDFNGKTIAVPSLGDQNTMAMRAWVDAGHGDSGTLSFVEVPSSAAAAAVAQGRVAAAVVVPPFAERAVADGKMRSLGDIFAAIAPRFLETGWFTTGAYATKNPDVCLRFAKIIGEASNYVNTHNAEVAPTVATFTGFSVDAILQNGIGYLAPTTDAREVQPLIDAMAKYGLIDHRINANDLILR